jgi:tripartite-type tricarboxylate transporter receptor subunit TctC
MKASVYKIGTPRRLLVHRGNKRRLVTQHPRRRILTLAAGAAALPALSRITWAQDYPARPVRIISPAPPGGANDITARLIGQWLSERLGQQFLIENRPGGGNNIGTEAVVRAPPDGYTLLSINGVNTANATLYEKLNFNFIRDIAPVAAVSREPGLVFLVHSSVPAKTVPEFIAYAKANRGKLSMASAGIGSSNHVTSEWFKMMTGVDMIHVPYRGGAPALTDVLGGQVHAMFATALQSIEYIREGKLRALALTLSTRSHALPDVPTLGDFLPGFEYSGWSGVGAPRNTPAEIIEKLNKEINAGLADTKLKARLADWGGVPMPMTPAELGKFIADETEKWGKVIRAAGIKVE